VVQRDDGDDKQDEDDKRNEYVHKLVDARAAVQRDEFIAGFLL